MPFTAAYFYLHFQKIQAKFEAALEMSREQDSETLVQFTFSANDSRTLLRWEHDREFEYLDQMYDVYALEYQGDSIHYWCRWDEAESAANRKLNELKMTILGKPIPIKDPHISLDQFFKSLYCHSVSALQEVQQGSSGQLPFNRMDWFSIFCTPPAPPPEVG